MEQQSAPPGWIPPSEMWPAAANILHFQCQRPGCGVWRHQAIDYNGYVMLTNYDGYPPDYKVSQSSRPTNEQIRLWRLKRRISNPTRHLKAVD